MHPRGQGFDEPFRGRRRVTIGGSRDLGVDFRSDRMRCRAIISAVRCYWAGGAGFLVASMAPRTCPRRGATSQSARTTETRAFSAARNGRETPAPSPPLHGDASAGGSFDVCPTFAAAHFPYVRGEVKWKCADRACHGGTTAPPIDGADPAACLATLKAITMGGKGYVVSGAAGAAESTILCNLQGGCGSTMPKPPGIAPTPSELCMLTAWLERGAR